MTRHREAANVATAGGGDKRASSAAEFQVTRTSILGLVLVCGVLVSERAQALVTDFDFAAGYLREGQYGKLYAMLTEHDSPRDPDHDSNLNPIGRNRPGRARRQSGRRENAPVLTVPAAARCDAKVEAGCPSSN